MDKLKKVKIKYDIKDEIKVLDISNLENYQILKFEKYISEILIINILIKIKEPMKIIFTNNEYLKLDFTNGEIIGLKSTSMIGNLPIGDLPAFDYLINNDDRYMERYKDADLINLGNVDTLYERCESKNLWLL